MTPKVIEVKQKKNRIIFPRYHQLDVVRKIVGDVIESGSSSSYLIQHSAGSGEVEQYCLDSVSICLAV